MFNPNDIKVKYYYKLSTKGQFAEIEADFELFKKKHPKSFVICQSNGICFIDFAVKVTPRSGELIFEKGNTDESSSATDPLTSHGEHSLPVSEDNSKEVLPKRV